MPFLAAYSFVYYPYDNDTTMTYLYLKQPLTRKQLADCLNLSVDTLSRRMQEIPYFSEQKSQKMLCSKDVTVFFNHYQYHPCVLGDLAVAETKQLYAAC